MNNAAPKYFEFPWGAVLRAVPLAAALAGCGGGDDGSKAQPSAASSDQSRSFALAVKADAVPVAAPLKGLAGKCLKVAGGTQTIGTRVQLFSCSGTDDQQWFFDGTQVKTTSGLCLDVAGAQTGNGANIIIWTCHGGQNQQWKLADGQLQSAASGKCLDVFDANSADEARVTLWECSGNPNQKWSSEAAAAAPTPTPTPTPTLTPPPAPASAPTSVPTPTPSTVDVSKWNGKDVVIPAGQTVMLDTDVSPKSVTVMGTLSCALDRDLNVSANWIMVMGGNFQCGTEAARYTKKLTITLTGNSPDENIMNMGSKVLGVMDRGQLNLHGESRLGWTRLAADAPAGATRLTLAQAPNWRAGDRIVLASSTQEAQSEELVVASVAGAVVELTAPLKFAHRGALVTVAGVSVDMRAEVGLLTRNIVIQGDEGSVASKFGGHVMVMDAGSNARIDGVQFVRMGQRNRVGRYPMHWHFVRDATGGYFKNNAVSHTIQRGLVVHATDNLVVEGNVVFDTQGHGYGVEDGTETGNVFRNNLGLDTHGADLPALTHAGRSDTQGDDRAATFWIVGAKNTFVGNAAAGGEHSGYWFQFAGPVTTFDDNVAHSYRSGKSGAGTNEQAGLSGEDSRNLKGTFRNLRLYSNAVGLWLGDDQTVLVNAQMVGNKFATFSSVRLKDSLVAGSGAGQDNGNEGLVTYKDLVQAHNVTFANFGGDRHAMRTFLSGPEGARFETSGLQFVNVPDASRIMLQADGGDGVADDQDGSLAGKPSTLTSDEPSMFTSACEARPAWRVHVCPQRLAYQSAFLYGTGNTLVRDDGSRQSLTERVQIFNVIAGRRYTYNPVLSTQGQVLNIWTNGAPGTFELVVPVAPGALDIFQCRQVEDCDSRAVTLSAAGSQQEMDASGGGKYFYDAAAGQVVLKVRNMQRIIVQRK